MRFRSAITALVAIVIMFMGSPNAYAQQVSSARVGVNHLVATNQVSAMVFHTDSAIPAAAEPSTPVDNGKHDPEVLYLVNFVCSACAMNMVGDGKAGLWPTVLQAAGYVLILQSNHSAANGSTGASGQSLNGFLLWAGGTTWGYFKLKPHLAGS